MGITAEVSVVNGQHVRARAPETAYEGAHHPDGLTLARVNALVEQVYREISATSVVVTTGLTDGSAEQRKWQRMEHRAVERRTPGVA
jgi:hypothetical protein